MKFKIK